MLIGYEGDFILAYRDNGTNLYRLNNLSDTANWAKQDHRYSIKRTTECCISFLSVNEHYLLINKDGKPKPISQYEAIDMLLGREVEALKVVEFFEQINLKGIAFELMCFIKHNGRVWKSRLQAEWLENSSTPALARLRNHFDHKAIFRQKAILAFADEESIFSTLAEIYMEGR
jgi:hypothetical protein